MELIEPGRNGDERTTLVEMLDYYRTVLVRKSAGLTNEQLHATPLTSTLSLGRLLAHMAFVEDYWFSYCFAGNRAVEPWASADFDSDQDWEMTWAADREHGELVACFDHALTLSRSIVADTADLATLSKQTGDNEISLRWILVHMIEEYARHVGHADMIRETLDGKLGD